MTEYEIYQKLRREESRLFFLEKMWRAGYRSQVELAEAYGHDKYGCPVDRGWVCNAVNGKDSSMREKLLSFLEHHPSK